jgi:ABC-2 type transport system permease protein
MTTADVGATTTSLRRLRAVGRAELTLMVRSKATLLSALVIPVSLTLAIKPAVRGMDLKAAGLSLSAILLPTSIGFVLLFAVYSPLVGVYVARRESLVLKRLRTGELTDPEILAGAALPTLLLALAQCALLVGGAITMLDVPDLRSPVAAAAGLLLGVTLTTLLSAATARLARTVESAQIVVLPLLMVSMLGSGLIAPRQVMPDRLAAVCEWLPLSPVMDLLRDGIIGAGLGEVIHRLGVALVWIALAVFAVRRWFRWEPRH